MILLSELYPIGYIQKTHGIKGELSAVLTVDLDNLDFSYFVFEMDGIFVPFFNEEYRFKAANAALIKLEGVDTENRSREFVGKAIFIHKKFAPQNEEVIDIQFYTGYTMEDSVAGKIGEILSIDDTTENLLFEVMYNGQPILIPAVDEWIVDIDDRRKLLKVNLPEGLLGINDAG